MEETLKLLKQKGIVCCVISILITVVIMICAFSGLKSMLPFMRTELNAAYFDDAQISEYSPESSPKQNAKGEVLISSIAPFSRNDIVGSITLGSIELDLCYDCDDIALMKRARLESGKYPGEIGISRIYAYKNSITPLALINPGDTIEISMPYGAYTFTVKEVKNQIPVSDSSLTSSDIKRGIVIYTDTQETYGISGKCTAVFAELTSGPKITNG